MDKKLATIYATKDYEKFILSSINRQVNDRRVDRIVQNLKQHNTMPPIEVKQQGDKLLIVDGQHRFYALRKLGKEGLLYIIQ